MFKNVEITRQGGLKCDAPSCEYSDMTILPKKYKKLIGAPCPKCGASLLTHEDYVSAKVFLTIAKIANIIPPPIWRKICKVEKGSPREKHRLSFNGTGVPKHEFMGYIEEEQ